MRSVFSWLINILAVGFWIFRVVVTFLENSNVSFAVKTINFNIEIGLLFATVIFLVLIFKRNIIGGIAYFVAYAGYFGVGLYSILVNSNGNFATDTITQAFVCIIAIFLGLLNLVDLVLSRNRKSEGKHKHTDWFFKDDKFDRKLDKRADKNNYRIF
ncbi:MAG: hypothetical protein FWF46_01305 [Oscillospiraceae bacterium]|nr:hypothetical protein [Oscillospiraceae bacterium]